MSANCVRVTVLGGTPVEVTVWNLVPAKPSVEAKYSLVVAPRDWAGTSEKNVLCGSV